MSLTPQITPARLPPASLNSAAERLTRATRSCSGTSALRAGSISSALASTCRTRSLSARLSGGGRRHNIQQFLPPKSDGRLRRADCALVPEDRTVKGEKINILETST
eukprot:scaffold77581_cov31-Tisochrysis_lutea.AAC.1